MAVDSVATAMPHDFRKMAEAVIHVCVHGEAGISGFITYIRGLKRAAYFEVQNLWLPCQFQSQVRLVSVESLPLKPRPTFFLYAGSALLQY